MASPCPTKVELEELLKGTLPPANSAALDQHLLQCAACRQQLNALAGGNESWLKAKQTPPVDSLDSPPLREAMNQLKSGQQKKSVDSPEALAGQVTRLRHLGDYEILEELGRGGMGVVYRARQLSLQRDVAVKVILAGQLASAAQVRRFRVEAEAAAKLDHPNIVPIIEIGEHEGHHFFSMKLVAGQTLAERICSSRRKEAQTSKPESGKRETEIDSEPPYVGCYEVRDAARLLAAIARALHYAHQRGVLHRDLKPGNILLDREGRPHVTDFGLAKLVEQDSSLTQSIGVMGSPNYMPPEQAAGHARDATTAVDVYSLGAILYELLTGRPPFQGHSPAQTLRLVLEQDAVSPAAHNPGVPIDLATICLKCLEKEPARRYGSAELLAQELDLFCRGEPIAARPLSSVERFSRWYRRNRLAFTAASIVAAALVIGFGASTWMFFREREARKRAVAAEQAERKLREEAELRELNTRAFQLTSQLLEPEAALLARKEALEAQRRLLGDEHPDVAESLEELARIFSRINNFPEAEKMAREALAIRRKHAPEGDLELAKSLQKFSAILRDQKRLPEAEELYGHVAGGARDAIAIVGLGKLTEAEELYREAVQIRRRLHGDENVDTAIAIHDLAVVVGKQNRCAEALALHKQAFTTCRKLLPDENSVLGLIGRNLLMEMIDVGQLVQADEFARDFVPWNLKGQPDLIGHVARLAFELFSQGRSQEAEQMLNELVTRAPANIPILRLRADFRAGHRRWKEAVDDFRRLIQLRSEDKDHTLRFDSDYHKLAMLLIQSGDIAGYREHCRKSVEQFGHTREINRAHQLSKACLTLPDSGVDVAIIGRLAAASVAVGAWGPYSSNEALAEYRQNRFASAADWAEKTLAYATQPGWITVETFATLAMARHQLKQDELAQAALKRAQEDAKTLPKLDSADVDSDWIDVIICDALLREAKALIQGSSETKGETK